MLDKGDTGSSTMSVNVYANHVEIRKEYYESGELQIERSFKDGKLDGICKVYFESGKLRYDMRYKDGRIVSGYIYTEEGSKRKMTRAHLDNINKRAS